MVKIDFTNFPCDDSHAQIPGKLFIMDNLEEDEFGSKKIDKRLFPVQVTMAVTFFCIKGQIDVNIGLKSYTITDNCSMMLLPGSFFEITNSAPDTKIIMMAISPDFMKISIDVRLGVEFGQIVTENPVLKLSQEEMCDIIRLNSSLKYKLLQKGYYFKEEVARNFISIIQCIVFNNVSHLLELQKEHKPSNRKEEIFQTFMEIAKSNYKTNRNIGFYADKMFVSPKYLSCVIHEVSGKYATDWINSFVILEAKAMLRRNGASVKDVAAKLHFANQSFFAKFFKQHTGFTPREYIKM